MFRFYKDNVLIHTTTTQFGYGDIGNAEWQKLMIGSMAYEDDVKGHSEVNFFKDGAVKIYKLYLDHQH